MLLAVDIGNSHTVIGIFKNDTLLLDWRIKTDRKTTADEIFSSLFALFTMKQISFAEIDGVIIACVVPQVLSSWMTFAKGFVDHPVFVNEKVETGITIATDTPSEVGADRVVNAVAAFEKYACPLIIVDFGTAITFDCVSGQGAYLGGAIAPGLGISLEALGQQTAQLPRVDISSPPKKAIGTNSIEAIKSGILFGYGGLVDGLIARIFKEFDPEKRPKVIATGGMALLISQYSEAISSVEPQLTLEGLALIYKRQKKNG